MSKTLPSHKINQKTAQRSVLICVGFIVNAVSTESLSYSGPGGPRVLPPQGSHRPVRARISAYGSSNHGFAARLKIERTVRTGARG